jgi:hypothetical protein
MSPCGARERRNNGFPCQICGGPRYIGIGMCKRPDVTGSRGAVKRKMTKVTHIGRGENLLSFQKKYYLILTKGPLKKKKNPQSRSVALRGIAIFWPIL